MRAWARFQLTRGGSSEPGGLDGSTLLTHQRPQHLGHHRVELRLSPLKVRKQRRIENVLCGLPPAMLGRSATLEGKRPGMQVVNPPLHPPKTGVGLPNMTDGHPCARSMRDLTPCASHARWEISHPIIGPTPHTRSSIPCPIRSALRKIPRQTKKTLTCCPQRRTPSIARDTPPRSPAKLG